MDSKDEYNTSKADIGDSTLSSNITASEALVESADLEQNLEDNSAVSQNHPLKTLAGQKFAPPVCMSNEPSLRNVNNEEGLSVGDEKSSMVEPRNYEAKNSAVLPTVQPGVPGMAQPEINDSAVPDKIQPEIGGNGEDNQRKAFFYISSSGLTSSESQSVSAENSAVPPTVQPGVPGMVQPEINDSAVPDKMQPEIGENGEDDQRKAFFYISSSELTNSSESQSVSAKNSAVPPTVQPGVPGMVQPEINDSAVPDKIHPEIGENGEDNQRKASFYISSSELKKSSESQSVSGVYRVPSETSNRRIVRQESREQPRRCLGSQRCHYIVVTITVMTALVGSIMYHVSHSGQEILKTIGASTVFISIVVCLFSSLYISYLSNYPQLASLVPNYELLGDVDSVMAMNRTSNPQYLYEEDGRSSDATEHCFSQGQSADILDRRIYRQHTDESRIELKRFSVDFSSPYSSPPLKRFKAKTGTDAKGIPLTELYPEVSTSNQATIPSEAIKENYDDISSAETSTDAQLTNLRVTVDEISDDRKNVNLRQELDTPEIPSNSQRNEDVKESEHLTPGKTG